VTIEATVEDVRALLELANADRVAHQQASEMRRPSREATARRVPPPLLDRYQLLLQVGRTPVIVAIERGACSGCHVRLPVMLEHRASRSTAIHTCPHCRRMLYAPQLVRPASDADVEEPARPASPKSAGKRSR
jgi:predicted  nucleic acid-binding Zn-ribbon protein